ncbi:MAG: hypothetical protein HFG19_08215 [Oscillospiraceae bacterium]|nr:hypothetical protein [Oscillospiraceae bacterium]
MLEIVLTMFISSFISALVSLTIAREASRYYANKVDRFAKSTMKELKEAKDDLFAVQESVLEQFDAIKKLNSVTYQKDK